MVKMSKKDLVKYSIIISIIVIVVIVTNCLYFFVITPTKISGDSMETTYSDGDIVLVNKVYKSIESGDIVIFYNNGLKLIKRVIGVANDIIEISDSILYVNGIKMFELEKGVFSNKTYYVEKEEYFVVGDNLNKSIDSRYFGKITNIDIIGVILI